MKRSALLLFMFLSLSVLVKGQTIPQYYLYSYNYALFNPAAAGANEKHIVALHGEAYVYEDALEDLELPYSGLLTYEGNFTPINSGIGAMAIMSGDVFHNTKKIGVSYNYNIKFAPSTSLRIGLRPTFSRYTVDHSKLTGGSEEKESSSKGDLDLGLYLNTFGFYVGASLNNIFEHEHTISTRDHFSDQMFSIVAGRKINLQVIQIDPSIAYVRQNNTSALLINSNFVLGKIFMVGGTFAQSLEASEVFNVSANAGLSLLGKVDFIAHVYSRAHHRPYIPKEDTYLEGMIRIKI